MRFRGRGVSYAWNERGATLALVAVSMVALLSVVALAIDIGLVMNARSEAQRAADVAAMAGAGTLIHRPIDDEIAEANARAAAEQFGELNDVQRLGVVIDPDADVEVDLPNDRVRVTVHRDQVRGGPVGTWFARIFGVETVDIAAAATAEAWPAGSARCLKPFSILDRFDDRNGNGQWDPGIDHYDPLTTGYGSDFANDIPGSDGITYFQDFGRPIVLKGIQGVGQGGGGQGGGKGGGKGGQGSGGGQGGDDDCCQGTGPSWYYPWDIPQVDEGQCHGGPQGQGASCYQWAIENCHPAVIGLGQEYMVENGGMTGPTEKGVNALIALDPGAWWNTDLSLVSDSDWDPWAGSPRIGIVPTYDPSHVFEPGKKPIEFTNFMAIFFESVEGNGNDQRVYGRILHATGLGGGETVSPTLKFVRLVE